MIEFLKERLARKEDKGLKRKFEGQFLPSMLPEDHHTKLSLHPIGIALISEMESGRRPIGKENAKKLAQALNAD